MWRWHRYCWGDKRAFVKEGGAHKELYPLRRGCKRDEGFLVMYVLIQNCEISNVRRIVPPNLVVAKIYMDHLPSVPILYILIYDWQKPFFRFKGA